MSPADTDNDRGYAEIRARFRRAFQLRNAAGVTTKEIAAELGVPASTVRNYASGVALPPPSDWPTYAKVLGVTERYFWHGDAPADIYRRVELQEDVAEIATQVAELRAAVRQIALTLSRSRVDRDALRALSQALGHSPSDDRL